MDIECDEVLHREMNPMEVALLVMLHRKHSDTITFNASDIRWKWKKGSLKSEFDKRVEKLKKGGKINTEQSSATFINEVERELSKIDLLKFPNEKEDGENSSSDIESEEKINNYMTEQNIKLSSMNRERVKKIIEDTEFDTSSDFIEDMNIKDNLLKNLDEINKRYKEKMMKQLGNQRDNMAEILNQYHTEQLEIVKKIDEERMKEILRRTCPSSNELVKSLKTEGDPNLSQESLNLIDNMTNNIRRKTTINPEELKKIFREECGRERQLKVGVELPHREEVKQGEDRNEYKNVLARHYRDFPEISINSVIVRGKKVQEGFDKERLMQIQEEESV
ncbi:uncharacterized protein LOC133195264 [Saccostrea echinata]|uniref:uncharacterized protein LOC133195264 n=1 Tax=Saccostrea echinata TaxID=191078 RepID=UPI002A817568|nr:uncharacterized protein LOC133195264 [Saccostrea echinata]